MTGEHGTTIAIATGTFGAEDDHSSPDPSILVSHVRADSQSLARLSGTDALVVGLQQLGDDELHRLPGQVRVIGRAGIGLDSIDLEAAARLGIAVVHQPSYATDEVADHATSLVFALTRNVVLGDRIARSAWPGWENFTSMPSLRESTLGLVGLGRIGAAVARRLAPSLGRILAYDPAGSESIGDVVHVGSLDDLLRSSDIVSLHLPLTPATARMIDDRALRLMRPGALLVNVSRGGLLDEHAVATALHDGHLGGVAVDVLSAEPPPADNPLLSTPRTILSPHVAWLSRSSQRRLRDWTLTDVARVAHGLEPEHGRLAVSPGDRASRISASI